MNNGIKWFEIPAADFERAVAFYTDLLGVELEACDWGEEKMAFFPEAEMNVGGAISWAKAFRPSADGTLVYFDATGRLDELLEKVESGGGRIVSGRTVIGAGDRGSFALFTDTEGNRLGFHAD